MLFAQATPLKTNLITVKFSLITSSIFLVVGNYLINDKFLRQTTGLTLIDKAQIVTVILILLNIITTVFLINKILDNPVMKIELKRIKWISTLAPLAIYIITNLIMMYSI